MDTGKHLEDFNANIPGAKMYFVPTIENLATKSLVLGEFVNIYGAHDISAKLVNDQLLNKRSYHEYHIQAKVSYSTIHLVIPLATSSFEVNEYEMYVLNRIFTVLQGKAKLEDYKGGTRASYTVPAAEPTAAKVEMVKQFVAKHQGRFVYVQHTKFGEYVTNNYLPLHPSDILSSYEIKAVGGGQMAQSLLLNLITEPGVNRDEIEELAQVIKPIKDSMPADVLGAIQKS